MTTAADSLRDFITPLLPGWHVQFGRWRDGVKTDRFAVLKPVGGLPVELVRRPQFTMTLIGAENEDAAIASAAAEAVITAMRSSSGALVFMQPAEPAFIPTADGRPAFELAISAITT